MNEEYFSERQVQGWKNVKKDESAIENSGKYH